MRIFFLYPTLLALWFFLSFNGSQASTPLSPAQASQVVEDSVKEEQQLESNADIEHQKNGKFPRLERQHALGAIQRVWDKAPRQAGIYTVTYSQEQLIRLVLREFMITTVVLPSWEVVEDIIVGDKSTFEAIKNNDHIVLIRPKEFVGADSNITVVGRSGLVYSFYVRSEGYNSKNLPDLRVHVHVPGDVPMSFPVRANKEKGSQPTNTSETASLEFPMKNNQLIDYPTSLPPKLSKLNFKWSMSGDSSIAPRQVFSDGVRTWFNFDDGSGKAIEQQDLPIIARVMDGVDTPVNTRIEGTMVIAETEGVFTLRNGTRTVCVYPTDFNAKELKA